jgi:lipopolysaccharide transport system ATP-binding protein
VGTGFHPELTGRENIFLNGAVLGMRNAEIKEKFDEIVAFAEIEKFLDTPVKHYSSGMSVRLGFAVAAHLQPEILIVDEVLAVGDMAFQKKCLGKMSEVSKSGRTVLFVSHNMAAVENLCQRGIVLQHGRMIYDGDTKNAIAKYMVNASKPEEGQGHEIDLSAAPTRKEKYSPIMQKVEVFTDDGQPAPRAVQVGARLTLKIHLKLPHIVPNFMFGVGFNSMFGQRVLTLNTTFDPNLSYEPLSGETVVVCEVPSLTLVPGEYLMFLFINFGSVRKDEVPDAFMLTVLDSDYYGTGKVPFSGVVVMPHSFSVEQAPALAPQEVSG